MKSFISKEDSKCLYGIAILLMIFHHCFLDPARLNNAYISSWGAWGGIETRLAWQGRLCVAIFAFISGYALALWSLQRKSASIADAYRKSLGQLMRLYQKYWLVFFSFVPLGIIIFDWKSSFNLIIEGLIFGGAYCGEWWYVKQYACLMIFFPVLHTVMSLIHNKKRILLLAIGCLVCLGVTVLRLFFWYSTAGRCFVWCMNTFVSVHFEIFVIAYLIAYYRVYEIISEFVSGQLVGIVGAVLIVVARYRLVIEPAQSDCDVYLTPFLVYFLTCILHTMQSGSIVTRILKCLGKYSTFMWLFHPVFLYHNLQRFAIWPKYSILIYIWVVLVSLLTAIVLEWGYNTITSSLKKCIAKKE